MFKQNIKLKTTLIIIFIFIFTSIFYTKNLHKHNQINQILNKQLQALKTNLDITTHYFKPTDKSDYDYKILQKIQKDLTNINKIHIHCLINKNLFKLLQKNKNNSYQYRQSIEHSDFLFRTDFTKNNCILKKSERLIIKPLQAKIDKNIALKKAFALYVKIDNTVKVISFLPIKNLKKDEVKAYIVSYTNSTHIKTLLDHNNNMLVVLFIALAILFLFIYKLLVQKKFLKDEVSKKTKQYSDINKNLEQIVNKEIEKNKKKEELLAQQSKLAALGEMMDAIAHQWKQPIGVIDLSIQNLAVKIEYGQEITNEDIIEVDKSIRKQVSHLVTTIDEFRQFFRPNQQKSTIKVQDIINSTITLMKDELISNKIKTEIIGDDKNEISCIPNEFKHIFINLINNSKDAFNEHKIKDKKIIFDIKKENEKTIIKVSDNAGGIPENIINNIFNSNFTTKTADKGTGIGLYLTKQIIEKLHATIEVENINYGVCFKIII